MYYSYYMNSLHEFNNMSDLDKIKNYSLIKNNVNIDMNKLDTYLDMVNNPDKYSTEIDIHELDVLYDMITYYNNIIVNYENIDDNFDEAVTTYVNMVSTINKCKEILDNYKLNVVYLD